MVQYQLFMSKEFEPKEREGVFTIIKNFVVGILGLIGQVGEMVFGKKTNK